MRFAAACFMLPAALAGLVYAQSSGSQTARADCTFEDGSQLSVQYNTGKGEEPRNGKLWQPGGAPMILFVQTPINLLASTIPPAAYSMYTIPNKKEWALVVNKNVKAGSSYDGALDIARASMEVGEIDQAQKELQISFAHSSPKVCSLRLYYGKVGAFVDFREQ